jgi:NHL repeat
MRVSRVTLAAPRCAAASGHTEATPLLDPRGASVILGARLRAAGAAVPIVPGAATLFGPRGACLAAPQGPLYVADTGHHRLLVWRARPHDDHVPADLVIGQPDFRSEGRNAKTEVSAATLNVPTGVATEGGALAVADAWNHRVLLWHRAPTRDNQPADVVLGQATFLGGQANRGTETARADTLNWCYGVAIDRGRLFVADTGNRRVLVWRRLPDRHGAPADLVLGQRDFNTRDENAGGAPGPVGMRWPHGIAVLGNTLLVADAGDNRVMAWRGPPSANGTPCDFVLGQPDVHAVDHNQAGYYPTASAMNMPYGLAVQRGRVIVADTANSRLVGFDVAALGTNAPARWLSGQEQFANKGDNRWRAATRDSVCWPYGVAASGSTLVIADAGNDRVLLWEAAP